MGDTPEYQLGDDGAIVLNYGGADQVVVAGINEITLPEYTSSTIEVKEFRKTKIKFVSDLAVGDIGYTGNFVLADEDGQGALAKAWFNKTKLQDCRLYLNNDADGQADFLTVDLANDANSCFQVSAHKPGKVAIGGTIDFSGGMTVGGRIAYFFKHLKEGGSPVTAFTASTITGVPATLKVKAGDSVIVEGSTSNDGVYLVESVADTTVTLAGTPSLTVENGIEDMELHFGHI